MDAVPLIVGTLAVWRITHLLAEEKGPGDAILRLRTAVDGSFWGGLMDCFSCLSIWIAIPFAIALADTRLTQLLLWPALSGGAILLERATSTPPATYTEDKDPQDELLR